MNSAEVRPLSSAALVIQAIAACASCCWRARPSLAGMTTNRGGHRRVRTWSEVGRVVGHEDVALALEEVSELRVRVAEHAAVTVASCVQSVFVSHLDQCGR